MNLFDLLANAQGGNGIEALARQFNLSPQQTRQAVEALLPAFSRGFKQNAADPYDLGSFLSALSSGRHARYFEDTADTFSRQGMAEGNGILGHLFGSKEVSRAVAEQASQATGIGQQVLKQMLPAIAAMLMGGLFRQTNNQMAAGGLGGSDNPLGELIEQMMRQGGTQQSPAPAPSQPKTADNPFGKMLEEIFGGQGQTGQSGRPAPQGRNPAGNNPLGEILDQILRGPQSGPGNDRGAPQRRTSPSGNPLEDIFGRMTDPGKSSGEDYRKGIDSIFDQYRRGMDRHR